MLRFTQYFIQRTQNETNSCHFRKLYVQIKAPDAVDYPAKRSHLVDIFRFIIRPRRFNQKCILCRCGNEFTLTEHQDIALITLLGNILNAFV